MKFYKRDPDAAIAGMAELTLEERGAYNTIIDQAYSRDGILPDDDRMLARMLGCHILKWRRIRIRLMTLGKIWVIDGRTLGVTRVEPTLEEARQFSKVQADRARIRWEKHRRINGTGDAKAAMPLTATAIASKKDKTLHQSDGGARVEKKSKAATEEEFNRFWQAYPRKVGKKAARRSFDRAMKDASLGIILGALAIDTAGWKEERFTPHPTTWLNEGRYLDRTQTYGQSRSYRPPGWTDADDQKLREHYANRSKDSQRPAAEAEGLLEQGAGVSKQNRH